MKRTTRLGYALAVLLSIALGTSCRQGGEPEAQAPEDLNQLAASIQRGMTKAEAIDLLGAPTWVGLPGDRGDFRARDEDTAFILYWRNPGFPVVQAHFDAAGAVRWDTGWSGEQTYTHIFEPPETMACAHSDRTAYCEP